MKELSVVTVVAAFAVVFAGGFVTVIDCGGDNVCSGAGQLQLGVALSGLVPALAMLVAALLGHGRPGLWFCAVVLGMGFLASPRLAVAVDEPAWGCSVRVTRR